MTDNLWSFAKSLLEYDSVKRWFTFIGTGSQPTKDLYLLALARFVRSTGKSPDELIKEREGDMRSDDRLVKYRYEEVLKEAFAAWEAEGKSRATCCVFFAAVKSFFKGNYTPLYARSPSVWPTKTFKVPNQEELRKMIEAATDPRIRLWILSQKDSGISGGDLVRLTYDKTESPVYGTVKEQLKSGQVPLHVNIMRGKFKEGGYYDTYLGEEAFDALQEAPSREGRIFDLSMRYVQDLIPKCAKKAGLKGPRVTPHAIRKYFNTYAKIGIRNYGATELLVEYWMGHSIGRVKGAYLAPPVEEQQKLYLSAYPTLRCLGSA
jgi:integrase